MGRNLGVKTMRDPESSSRGETKAARDRARSRHDPDTHGTIAITDVPEASSSAKDIVKEASKRRRAHFLFTFLSALLLILVVAMVSIATSVSLNFVSIVGMDVPLGTRYALVDLASWILLVIAGCIWGIYVFWDGWFLYPPSNPVRGRRGTTRQWFNDITFMVNQEPAEVTEGLTGALNASLNSKIRSTHIFFWGLALMLSFLAITTVTLLNIMLVNDYFLHLSNNVYDSIHGIQFVLVYVISFGTTTIGDRPELESGSIVMLLWFLLGQMLGAWVGFQLIRNAIDMRWSLLTTPDVLYLMLKNTLLVRNNARDYDLDDAIVDARQHVFGHGINKTPEDFVDMEGRLYFYSSIARDAFLGTGRPNGKEEVKQDQG